MSDLGPESETAEIHERLTALARERAALQGRLVQLERAVDGWGAGHEIHAGAVTTASKPAEKVARFKRLFAGRHDVFPLRGDNAKTGKSGYALACENEWVRGVCKKPPIKCRECPNQRLFPYPIP